MNSAPAKATLMRHPPERDDVVEFCMSSENWRPSERTMQYGSTVTVRVTVKVAVRVTVKMRVTVRVRVMMMLDMM